MDQNCHTDNLESVFPGKPTHVPYDGRYDLYIIYIISWSLAFFRTDPKAVKTWKSLGFSDFIGLGNPVPPWGHDHCNHTRSVLAHSEGQVNDHTERRESFHGLLDIHRKKAPDHHQTNPCIFPHDQMQAAETNHPPSFGDGNRVFLGRILECFGFFPTTTKV